MVAASLAGHAYRWWVIATALVMEFGAALWAQLVEGWPQLLRPYGYFGAVAGVAPPSFDSAVLPLAAGLTVVTFAAYGVDFPRSRRRFSRLV